MRIVVILSAFFTLSVGVGAEYYLKSGDKVVVIDFSIYEKVLVNDICARESKRCHALKQCGPVKKLDKEINKARAYCKAVGGVNLTLYDKKMVEGRAFCAFDDKSVIDAWGCYQRSLP